MCGKLIDRPSVLYCSKCIGRIKAQNKRGVIDAANFEYINVYKLPRKEGKNTDVYEIKNNTNSILLGTIKWYFQWRQYCFFPEGKTIWNTKCLNDIIDFLERLRKKEEENENQT